MRVRSQRGLGLAGTLVLAMLVFTLALAISGAGLFHLNLSTRETQEKIAGELAESAVSKMMERVLEQESRTGNLDYGTDLTATERVEFPSAPEGSYGLATFNPSHTDPDGTKIDPCVNNLLSDSSVPATNGTVIPRESLYLAGYGVSGGVERRVEAVVYLPRFPYSIACQGPFRGSDLLIAGVADDTEVVPGTSIPPELLEAGHLVSNSTSGNRAVELGGQTRVKGDVKSASGVQLGPSATVDGQLLLHSSPAEIPTINVSQYRPTGPDVFQGLLALERGLELGRTAYYDASSGPLNIVEGLTLDGGFLYVDGDLTISGGVHGKGAVVVTGDLTIDGAGSLGSDNVAAFLAGGDISIHGSGTTPKDSVIEGLVYAGGRASIKDVTLVGTLLSAGTSESYLENSVLLQRDQRGAIEILGIDTSTYQDPTTWEHVDFQLSETAPPDAILKYSVVSTQPIDEDAIYGDLARNFNDLEMREVVQTGEELEALTTEREGNPDNPLSGGIEPWYGYLIVAPVSETQERTVITKGATINTVTDVVNTKTILSIDLSDFVTPVERMRVKWWRTF